MLATQAWLVVLTLAAAVGSGLVAGGLFAFSSFVITALGQLGPDNAIAAMRSVNRVIVRSWFMAVFLGTALLCVGMLAVSLMMWGEPGTSWRVTGSVIYLLGVLGVTGAFNVPRNNALQDMPLPAVEAARAWADYARPWMAWNHIRTVASLAATMAFVLAWRATG